MHLSQPDLAVMTRPYLHQPLWLMLQRYILFCFIAMRFVTIVWIREIKLAKIIFLCLILKFEEIFPKNRKLSPKNKIISPINRKISPKDKMIFPKENCLQIIYPGTDCCRWFSVACRTGFWMWFLGGEGEGCIFNLYIIFFILGFFRFLTLGSFFRFLPLPFTRIYKKEFSNLHPSPFWRFFWWSESYGWRVVKALSCFVLNTFLHLDI